MRNMVVVGHLVHKYDELLCSVHHGGHPASHHGPPVGEGHGWVSPKIQGGVNLNINRYTVAVTVSVCSIAA